jgi:hypothetical protein
VVKKINVKRLNKAQRKRLARACRLDDFATYLQKEVSSEAAKASYHGKMSADRMAKEARKQAKRAWTNYRKACK